MGVKFKGFRKFTRAFNRARAKRRLRSGVAKRMRKVVLHLRTEILDYIDSEKHGVPNSPLTVLIKGSSKPLVDRGDLRLGVTTEVAIERANVVGAVGVKRSRRTKKGKKLFNVAAALHEGFTIKVTPAVRAAVFAELRKRQGKKVRADSSGTAGGGARNWKVKGRPFISDPFKANVDFIIRELGDGIRVTFKNL